MTVVDAKGRVWVCVHTDRDVDPNSTVSHAGWCPFCGMTFHEPRGFCRTRANRNGRLRSRLLERDGNSCRYCLREFGPWLLATIDHIRPRSKGGSDSIDNLCLACTDCNAEKADQLGVKAGAYIGRWPELLVPA